MDAAKALLGTRVFMSRIILDSKGAKFLGGDRAHPAHMYVHCKCQACQQGQGHMQPGGTGGASPQTPVMSLVDFLVHCYPGAEALGEDERGKLALRHTLIEIDVAGAALGLANPIYFNDAMVHLGMQARNVVQLRMRVWVAQGAINNRAIWEYAGYVVGFNDATGCHLVTKDGQQAYEVHFALNNVGVEDPGQPDHSKRVDGPLNWQTFIANQAPWLPHPGLNYVFNRNIQAELSQLLAKAVQDLPDEASARHTGIVSKGTISPTMDTAISNVTPVRPMPEQQQQHAATFAHQYPGTQSASTVPSSHPHGTMMPNVGAQPAYAPPPQQIPGQPQPTAHQPFYNPHMMQSQPQPPNAPGAFSQQPPGFTGNPAIPSYPQQAIPGQFGAGVHPHGTMHGMPPGQPGAFGHMGAHAPQMFQQPGPMQQQSQQDWSGAPMQHVPGTMPQVPHMQHASMPGFAAAQPQVPQYQQQPYMQAHQPQPSLPGSIPNQPPPGHQQAMTNSASAAAGLKNVSGILAAMLPPQELELTGNDAHNPNKVNVTKSLFVEGMMHDFLDNVQGMPEEQWHALSLCWQFLPASKRFQLYTRMYEVLSSIPQPSSAISTELPGVHDWTQRIYQEALEAAEEDLDMLGQIDVVRKLAGRPVPSNPSATRAAASQ